MKKLLFFSFCLFGISVIMKSQTIGIPRDTVKLLLENDKMKVTEFIGNPGKDVCGAGIHTHNPHLAILLTDASVILTTQDGKSHTIEAKAGSAYWNNRETHAVINNGDKVVIAILVEPK